MDRFIFSNKAPKQKRETDWVPILSLALAIITILANIVITDITNRTTRETKEFELTFQEKRKLYTDHSKLLSKVIINIDKLDTLLSTVAHNNQVDSVKSNILGERLVDSLTSRQKLRALEDEINNNILDLFSNGTEMSPFLKSFKINLRRHLYSLNDTYTLYLTLVVNENHKAVVTAKKEDDFKPDYKHLESYKKDLDKVTADYSVFITDTLFYKLFPDD